MRPYSRKLLADENTTTILAHDKLLTLTDIYLALWRDAVETATTRIARNGDNSEAVVYVATDTVVGSE